MFDCFMIVQTCDLPPALVLVSTLPWVPSIAGFVSTRCFGADCFAVTIETLISVSAESCIVIFAYFFILVVRHFYCGELI